MSAINLAECNPANQDLRNWVSLGLAVLMVAAIILLIKANGDSNRSPKNKKIIRILLLISIIPLARMAFKLTYTTLC